MANTSLYPLTELSVAEEPVLPPPDALPELSVPGKRELMAQLQSHLHTDFVSSRLWAAFWLADVEVVQKAVEDLASGGQTALYVRNAITHCDVGSVLRDWQAKRRVPKPSMSAPSTPSQSVPATPIESSPHPPGSSIKRRKISSSAGLNPASSQAVKARDRAVVELCRERDNNRCTLTGYETYDVCHLYPWCLNNREGTGLQCAFWDTLGMFWSQEKLDAWKAAVTGENGTEILENLLSLNPVLHREWGQSRWALQPLSLEDDETKLVARFYRFPKYPGELSVPLTREPILPADFAAQGSHPNNSGDIVQLRTPDPARLPLPSMAILEMQWMLCRVIALAGAAESQPDEWDSDSDSEIEVCAKASTDLYTSPSALHDMVGNLGLPRQASIPTEEKRGRVSLRVEEKDASVTGSENVRPGTPPSPP